MIRNLAKFRPNITQPGTGPPSSPPWSGFSGISWSVILVHMRFIRTGSPKSASQSSSLEQCNTFVFPVRTFLTTYVGTPSATHGFARYAGHYPTGSSASAADHEKHPASPVHGLQIATLRPRPYRSYRHFCRRASFRAESCAIFTDFRRCLYSVSTYSSMVHVRLCSRRVGNSRSIGSRGLQPNIR